MTDLSKNDVKSMGKAVGLDIKEPDLSEVTEVINAIIEAVDEINPPGLDAVEPLPVIPPPPRPKSLATGASTTRRRGHTRSAAANGRRSSTRSRAGGRATSSARGRGRRAKTSRGGR